MHLGFWFQQLSSDAHLVWFTTKMSVPPHMLACDLNLGVHMHLGVTVQQRHKRCKQAATVKELCAIALDVYGMSKHESGAARQ